MPIIPISNLSLPALDVYARLTENQLRNRRHPDQGCFIAESPKVISRALDAGFLPKSILMESRHMEGEGRMVLDRCGDIPVYVGDFDTLTELTGFQLTRGMLCCMGRRPLLAPELLLQKARRVAVLENVMNPTNVGAIFRSAAALGMDAVLLTPACADPLYRRASRVSMGTVFQVPWTYLPKNYMDTLKSQGFKTVAMALRDESIDIRDSRLLQEDKLAVFLGTEGDGLAKNTTAHCDYTIKIPMTNGVDSLNVAAASAVAFFQLGNH